MSERPQYMTAARRGREQRYRRRTVRASVAAIDAGVEGVAVFGIQVAVTGDVVRAWLVDSDVSGSCNIEAQRALLQWRFAPYFVRGRPAPFLKHYRIRFCFRDDLAHGRRERLESESFSRP